MKRRIRWRIGIVGVVAVLVVGGIAVDSGWAQHGMQRPAPAGPPAHMQLAQSCATAFEKNIGEGRGFGMAFVADQNGYPGPLHVLELKDRLKLTADQEPKAQAMLHAMFAESRPKGAQLLEAEAKLRRLFTERTPDEASIRAAVAEIERARSEVRLLHLMFHLTTRDLLTEEQRHLYHEARWGAHE